ncbi:MAG: coproporphyrinogen dehydrogenase HemZ [Ruminococcaceae bacterium]|nr:coproporphyrinogen dehydrogenase HemZ [Oscillospiraceae bacterium]
MKICLVNHNERYAVCEIAMSYFPHTKFEDVTEPPVSGDYVVSELKKDGDTYSYITTLSYGGRTQTNTVTKNEYNKTYFKQSFHYLAKDLIGGFLPWGVLTGIRPGKIARELIESGLSRAEVEDRFLTHYLTDGKKADLAIEVAENELPILKGMDKNAVSLYVGIPFCPTRCLYCSFTSQSIKFTSKFVEPYLEALYKEIEYTASKLKETPYHIETVYIGGGTPTSLTAEQLDGLIKKLHTEFDMSTVREFSVEAGRPDTIDADKLSALYDNNVTRISINPQTINDKTLQIIGRSHSGEEFLKSYQLALDHGFKNINTDIIAGLPGESTEDFLKTLSCIESLNPANVTVHTMSIKHGSFLARDYDMYNVTSASAVNEMLDITYDRMKALGKKPYYMYRQKNMLGNLENVGYADKGYENLYNIYIMEEVQSIIALGVGASTKIVKGDCINRVFNVKDVYEYITRHDEMLRRKDLIFK